MLSDASCLACYDVRLAYVVEQRCLTMVNMSHDGDDRSTWEQVVLVVLLLTDCLAHLGAYILGLKSELIGHEIDCLGIEALVDRYHDAYAHTSAYNLVYLHVHHRGELANGDKLGKFQYLALCCLLLHLLVETLLHCLTLLTTVFRAFLVLVFVCQTCQRLFYLACHIFLTHLDWLRLAILVLVAVLSSALLVSAIVASAVVIIIVIITFILLFLTALLCGSSLDVNSLVVDTHALFLLSVVLLYLFLAFFSALFLRLFLWTGALVEGVKVYLSQDIDFRSQFFLAFESEYLIVRVACSACLTVADSLWFFSVLTVLIAVIVHVVLFLFLCYVAFFCLRHCSLFLLATIVVRGKGR